jgi:hypothetical protein
MLQAPMYSLIPQKRNSAEASPQPQKGSVFDDYGTTITAKGSLLAPLLLADTCVLMFASHSLLVRFAIGLWLIISRHCGRSRA